MTPALLYLKLKGSEILIKSSLSVKIVGHFNFFKKTFDRDISKKQYPKILEDKS